MDCCAKYVIIGYFALVVVSFLGAKLNQNNQGKSTVSEILDTHKELGYAVVVHLPSLWTAEVKMVFPAVDCRVP